MAPQLRPRKRDAEAPKSRKRSSSAGRQQTQQPKKRSRRSIAASVNSSSSTPSRRCLAACRVFGITELIEKIFLECDQATLLTSVCRVSKEWHSIVQTSTPIQQALFFLPIPDSPTCSAPPLSNPILAKHFSYFFTSMRHTQCHHIHGFPDLDFYNMFNVSHLSPGLLGQPGSGETDSEDDEDDTSGKPAADRITANDSDGQDNSSITVQVGSISAGRPSSSTRSRYNGSRSRKRNTLTENASQEKDKLDRYFRAGASWRRMLVRQPPAQRLAYAERTFVFVNYDIQPHYDYYKGLLESPMSAKAANVDSLPLSITTPFNVATGGLRMDTLYDTVQLNLSRMTIRNPASNPEGTYLESKFHVFWGGVPKTADCPDDRMRSQIRRAVGKAGKETVVVQILAEERPMNHRMPTKPKKHVQSFGPLFRSQEAAGDPHFIHKKGTHAITGPNWLKKKWVSERTDDAGFMLHWADLTDEFDDFDDLEDFDAYLFQDLLDHHMMGLHDFIYDPEFGWDVWDDHYYGAL